ncbi:MAG TPA: 2-oxoglutarate dehydrogenase complex dihydrolipoyllysine-residue succinyltransferase [Tepidisphaeraceae bacterium]|nr:2-oxoglutarate dehydrogenase complex dihydrolipoyllysine-residue succinyltransferase [Tepidisphaeraceae bacterium]
MAIEVVVPPLGESVTQATLIAWRKKDGETVRTDEPLCELETDKANVDIPATATGVLRHLKNPGDAVRVGEAIARIDPTGAGASAAPATQTAAAGGTGGTGGAAVATQPAGAGGGRTLDDLSPGGRRVAEENKVDPSAVTGTGRGGRATQEDVQNYVNASKSGNGAGTPPTTPQPPAPARHEAPASVTSPTQTASGKAQMNFDDRGEHRAPMSKIRRRIAETLVRAQQTAAILTTFNEVDMGAVMDLRSKWKDQFEKTHGVGLGFMSFFARAVVQGLREFPHVNAFIEGDNIVYHQGVHLGIAVSTDRGLAVPVLKNAHTMSFARIESEIKRLATATRDGKLGLEELSGGTFTITNGGVFGSLLSTPILNPPQSGILGMHTIQKRPMVINDKIEIRPMMYLALSYDHRIVDGKDAIGFLVRVKQLLEDPARLMLEV